MDYTTPFINWLLQSEYVRTNKLFLNAVQAQDNNLQIITQQIPENQVKRYVDGSKTYPITFSIANYKSVSYNQIVKNMIDGNENISSILDVAKIIEFVKQMNDEVNFPKFGEKIRVEKVYCQYNTPPSPTFNGGSSPLAKFIIPVVCEVYEDGE